jgi:hypothetical protein
MQGSSFDRLRINSPEGRRMRGAVATNKEQLLARPRDGERAGSRRDE